MTRVVYYAIVMLIAGLFLGASCGEDENVFCAKGKQKGCACIDGAKGQQTCNDDGSGYGGCVCCESGAQQPCDCPNGQRSAQTCRADGNGFDTCICGTDTDPDGYIEFDTDTTEYGEWCDPATDLCWQNPERYREGERGYHWEEAKKYCDELVTAGSDAWRLPTITELRSIVRGCSINETGGACPIGENSPMSEYALDGGIAPCMDDCFSETADGPAPGGCFWPNELGDSCRRLGSTSPKEYWSATEVANSKAELGDTYVWYIFFGEGAALGYNFYMSYSFVRCVRTGP